MHGWNLMALPDGYNRASAEWSLSCLNGANELLV